MSNKIRCVILNRNYPPASGITGHSAADLADYLICKDIEISIVCVSANYSGGGLDKNKVGNIYQIKQIYSGKIKIFRLISNLIEGFLMLKKAISLNINTVICMTDPPLINFFSGILLNKKKIRWVYWSMDLYPDAFVSAGIVSKKNIFYKFILTKIKKFPPNLLMALGSAQRDYILKKYQWNIPTIILPCGISNSLKLSEEPIWSKNANGKILIGYVGNLGEAHNFEFIYEVIRNIDPSKYLFILSVYGSKALRLINLVSGTRGLIIVENIPQSQLCFIDIHLTSLNAGWEHVCVPSKAVSAITNGSTILFYGDQLSDTWKILNRSGWIININKDIKKEIIEWFEKITLDSIILRKNNSIKIKYLLENYKNNTY